MATWNPAAFPGRTGKTERKTFHNEIELIGENINRSMAATRRG